MRALAEQPRLAALVLGGAFFAAAATARVLEPDPRGFGTHEQLGFPSCQMLSLTGVPCPFCGMTTALAHIVRGRVLDAFSTHPAGTILFLSGVCGVFGALASEHRRRVWWSSFARFGAGRLLGVAGGVFGVSWLYVIGKTLL